MFSLDAVSEYKKRRQSRLDAKAVYDYRERRDQRWIARMDAEEDENQNNVGGGSGGHGNTKIPFGLCQREGINVDPKWTPKDAWKALEGKGYSAGEVYKELKKTGKAGKPAKAKKPATKIEKSHFPSAMTSKTYEKNTMEFAKFINEHCDDGEVTGFLSAATLPGAKTPPGLSCRRTTRPTSGSVGTRMYRDGRMIETTVTIPNFSAIKDPDQKEQAVRTFAHEWTHYIDLCARGKEKFGHYSEENKDLLDAIKADDGKFGKEAGDLFKEYNDKYDELRNQEKKDKVEATFKLAERLYGKRPEWLRDDGVADYSTMLRSGMTGTEIRAYEKEVKKVRKAVEEENLVKREALMHGVSNLQGLYDSLNGGALRESGIVKFGHSRAYFRRDSANRAIEMIADYVALKATSPKLAEVFDRDKPEIAKRLNEQMVSIVKRLRGE